MAVPVSRTLVVPVPTSAPPPVFALAEINTDLDYALDFGQVLLNDPVDPIVMLTMRVKPSGTLEAVIDGLTLQGTSVAAFNVNGTLGARVYLIQMGATLVSGRRETALATLQFDWSTQPYPIPYPDSPDWGPPVTWGSVIPARALLGVGGEILTGVGGEIILGTLP
jgi:hypothetical protein